MKSPFTHRPYIGNLACIGIPEAKTICHRGHVINEEEAAFILRMLDRHDALVTALTIVDELAVIHTDIFEDVAAAVSAALEKEGRHDG